MPELGSAYFTLMTVAEPFVVGVEEAEVAAKQATTAIAEQFGMVDASMATAGEAALATGAEFEVAGAEMATGMEAGATAVVVASEEAAVAGEAAAVTVGEAWTAAKGAMMGLFGGAMVVGGLSMITDKAIETAHGIEALAAAYGLTNAEAFHLDEVTKMVGLTGQSTMMMLARLTKAAGDETSTSAVNMTKYGIAVDEFRNAKGPEQLAMLAEAFEKAGTKGQQFLSDVVGPRGMKMAPLLADFKELNGLADNITPPEFSEEAIHNMGEFQIEMKNVTLWLEFHLLPAIIKLKIPLIALLTAFMGFKIVSAIIPMFQALGTAFMALTGLTGYFTAATAAETVAVGAETMALEARNAVLLSGGTVTAAAAAADEAYTFATGGATVATMGMAGALWTMLAPLALIAAALVEVVALWKIYQIHQETMAALADAGAADMRAYNLEVVNTIITTGGLTDEQAESVKGTMALNEEMKQSADMQAKLDQQLEEGRITYDEYTTTVNQLGLEVNTTAKEFGIMSAQQQRTAAMTKTVNHLGFKNMKMFSEWRGSIMDTMSDSMMSVGSFQKKWAFTGRSFVKTMDMMAKKNREMVHDLARFDKMAVPAEFKTYLISQGPDAIHGFMQANKKGQASVVKDWKKSGQSVEDYDKLLGPVKIAGDEAFSSLATNADNSTSSIDLTAAAVEGLHAKLLAMDGMSVTATVHTGTGKAAGGPVGAGRPYIVGEVGPEMFVPDGNGTIIPNHNLSRVERDSGGGGGGGAVVTRLRIDDWSTGMATIEVMARDAARDETGQDGARRRARRLS